MGKIATLLMLMICTSTSMAQSQDWQKAWNDTVAAAKKEGKVVVAGSPDPVMRNEIIPKFTARFGIPVDFIAGKSGQIAGRVRTERSSGIYSIDVFMAGASTTINVLYAEKLIDPLKPLLILPEVTDGTKWKRGKPWFADPDGQYVLMLFSSVDSLIFVNAAYVKPEEMRAAKDLLNPKWKGKIATEDPNTSGSGSNSSVHFYSQMGADFVKKLYIDQKPAISRDRRQLTDWLARGTYPICLTCRVDDARALQKEGFKLMEIFDLSGMQNRVNSAPFLLTVANKAPHPNAARVFVNWLASKEALEIYSRNYESATLRTDVDESFLDPRTVPRPGVTYPDDTDLKWVSSGRRDAAEKVRELLKQP
ncbi:MAG: extracellular solute-binding protein [Burkholderiales bacterium]|nr:extracellular solute-binding protein [Burkholderiales bacterium]